jgi:hypothetical protein
LINACWGTGSRRVTRSKRSNSRNRSGVVNASNDSSHARLTTASSASKTATISYRLLEPMFECYSDPPTTAGAQKPVKRK